MRRKVAAALLFSLTCLLLVSPWLGWQAAQPDDGTELFAYYSKSNYQNWNLILGFTVSQKIRIVFLNLAYLIASPAMLLGFWPTPSSVFFLLAFDVLILIGFAADLWERIRPVHIFLVAYSAIILLWAWPPIRFLVPIVPFLLFFGYRGLVIAFKKISRRTMSPVVTGVVVAGLLANLGYVTVVAANNTLARGSVSFYISAADKWEDLSPLLGWVRANTAPEAVLQSNLDPVVYLYAGRKTIRGFLADPFELFYASDPDWPLGQPRAFGMRLVQHKVDYVVRTPSRAYKESPFLNELIDTLVAEHPGAFRLVYAGPNPEYRIYRVDNMTLRQGLAKAPR